MGLRNRGVTGSDLIRVLPTSGNSFFLTHDRLEHRPLNSASSMTQFYESWLTQMIFSLMSAISVVFRLGNVKYDL